MVVTQNNILNYMEKKFDNDSEQLEEFFSLIGDIFSNIQPPVPNIKETIKSVLSSDLSLNFNMGPLLFTTCFEKSKVLISPNIPPVATFILTPPGSSDPTYLEVSNHIASLISVWVATGQNPSGAPLFIV